MELSAAVKHAQLCIWRAQQDFLFGSVETKTIPLIKTDGPLVTLENPHDDLIMAGELLKSCVHQRIADLLAEIFFQNINCKYFSVIFKGIVTAGAISHKTDDLAAVFGDQEAALPPVGYLDTFFQGDTFIVIIIHQTGIGFLPGFIMDISFAVDFFRAFRRFGYKYVIFLLRKVQST